MSEQETSKATEQTNAFSRIISHPVVVVLGLVGAVASLVSIPLAVYLYVAAKDYPQLSYYVNPSKAVIVRSGEASRLTASYDGQPITTDITAAQISIWNLGTQAIKKDDVLQPVVIYTENNAPILEAAIRKSSREVTQLSLNTEALQKGQVTVFWNILERNDGGVIQLIYAGDTNLQIRADGVIEGQGSIHQEQFVSPGASKLLAIFTFGVGLLLTSAASIARKEKQQMLGSLDSLFESFKSLRKSTLSSMELTRKYPNDDESVNVEILNNAEARLKDIEHDEHIYTIKKQRMIVTYNFLFVGACAGAALLYIFAIYFFINQPLEPPIRF